MTSTKLLQEVDKLEEYFVHIMENGTANGDDVLKILEYFITYFLTSYSGGTGKDLDEVYYSFCESLKMKVCLMDISIKAHAGGNIDEIVSQRIKFAYEEDRQEFVSNVRQKIENYLLNSYRSDFEN